MEVPLSIPIPACEGTGEKLTAVIAQKPCPGDHPHGGEYDRTEEQHHRYCARGQSLDGAENIIVIHGLNKHGSVSPHINKIINVKTLGEIGPAVTSGTIRSRTFTRAFRLCLFQSIGD